MAGKHKKKKKHQKGAQKKRQSGEGPSKAMQSRQKAKKSVQASESSTRIKLTEKIRLDSSGHSYRTFFYHRYGKHLQKAEKPFSIVARIVGVLFVFVFFLLLVLFVVFGSDLPDVSKLKAMEFSETTNIYDREGNVLYSIYGEENRKYVPLNYIGTDAMNATLAIEDKNFYHHLGFDILGMVRAQLKNISEDEIKQGASTITQQLAKNIFLSSERTYDRKIKELLLSLQIEWMFSKDEILEMYLNKIAYGSNSFGIEAAAQTFFGKSSHDLSLVESAVLAALPKAPSYYSPYGQNRKELLGYCKGEEPSEPPRMEEVEALDDQELALGNSAIVEETLDPDVIGQSETVEINEPTNRIVCTSPFDPNYVWGRKDLVLERMVEDGYIAKEQMVTAWHDGQQLAFAAHVHKIEAPHFVFYVKELLEQKYGKELVENGGLEVKTTLDPQLQSIAEEAVAKQAPINLKRYNANNAGLVAIDPGTGGVLAMVGSVDYWDGGIDGQVNVTTSLRQPGSAFKPVVYAAAIQNSGIGSGTSLGDYKTVFNKKDVPRNSDGGYKGSMNIRRALAESRNIPAIKAYYLAGEEEKLLEFLDKVGLAGLRKFKDEFNKSAAERGWTFNYGWPMAIGSGEVKLIDLTSAYGALANGGTHVPVYPILEVRDRKGNILEKFENPQGVAAVDPQAAYIVNNILSDAGARPAGSWRANLTIPDRTVAVKTGTSNTKVGRLIAPNNLLTIGYTPSIAAGVWVGNTDGKQMRGSAWGLFAAAPIWKEFLMEALKEKPDEKFVEPTGLVWKGREVYPSFAQLKTNFDSRFKRLDETQETQIVPDTLAVSSSGPNGPGSVSGTINTEAAPKTDQLPPVPGGF